MLALVALWSAWGAAQTLGFAVNYSSELEPEVQLRDLEAGPVALDLRAAGGVVGPLEGGAATRFRSSFGPLGTVAGSARADLDTAGGFDLRLSGTGALASTGARAELEVFNRNPGHFAPTSAYELDTRPFLTPVLLRGGFGAWVSVGVTQRLGRTLILEAEPALTYLRGAGFGGHLAGVLELRRLAGSDNGAALLEADLAPGGERGFAAAGLRYDLNRRGLPTLSAALLLGGGSEGVFPGARLSVEGEEAGVLYRAALAAEPYRSDVPPFRADAGLLVPAGPGVLGFELGGAATANRFGVAPRLLRSSYAVRF